MVNQKIRRAIRLALAGGAAASAMCSLPAMAQDQSPGENDAEEMVGRIVVTGSRIPRANITAPTQVTTIDSEVIEYSGLGNAADILRAVPSFGVSGLSTNNSNFLTAGGGINTLELRNLAEDRTLVLVNGRRYVSGVSGSAAVDFNTIPVELIDRVEVITGGASAIYGSDALAGVVNVILKEKYEGVDVGYQFGESAEGDDKTHRLHFIAGGNFADDRGNALVSATFAQQKGVLSRDRDNTAVDDLATCLLTGETSDCETPAEGFFSSFSERGRFFIPSTGASFSVSDGTGPTGTVAPWSTAQFGFNRQQFRRYSVPTDRFLLTGNAHYDLSDSVSAFIETTYAQTDTTQELEPFPHSNSDLNIGGISVTNPFVPQAIRDAVVAAGDNVIEYTRRMTEVGQRGADATRNTYRFVVGLKGDIKDSWQWETYYGQGRMEDSQQGGGQINVANMREALNAVDGDGDANTFDPVCANPAAVAEGCVPINIFGLGAISEDAANYVRAPTQRQQRNEQEIAGASIGGSAFELPAGSVDFAFGAEWRREHSQDVPDALTQTGQNAGNTEAPIFGDYDVGEAFVEVDVPLLADITGVHELSIGGAFRYSDYSTVGTTDAYTGRLSWAPIESLRFRGQYARAVRAPNIGELFSPGGENFAPVADPCQGVTAATTGQVAENCRAIPAVAARIAATGSFNLTQTEIQGTGGFTGAGNPNLTTEGSDSYSLGVVFTQDFGGAGNIMASVDWFSIEIEEVIDTVARQDAVDFCFNAANFPNQFCALLTRDVDGPTFQQGELTEVNSGFINEGTLKTEGIDLSLLWSWRMESGLANSPSNLSVRMNYTYLLDYTQTGFGAVNDQVGEVGLSEHEGQFALVYSSGPFAAQWETTYVGDAKPDTDPTSLFFYDVGTFIQHDLRVAYDLFEGTNLFLGVNNVLDEDAPIILSGVPGNVTGTDTNASVYDPIGRTYYGGFRVKF